MCTVSKTCCTISNGTHFFLYGPPSVLLLHETLYVRDFHVVRSAEGGHEGQGNKYLHFDLSKFSKMLSIKS